MMSKNTIRFEAPKQRNWVARAVRDPNGPYRPKTVKNKTKKSPRYKKIDWED
jgi:hypothetical protein